jgi:hypothetical protein
MPAREGYIIIYLISFFAKSITLAGVSLNHRPNEQQQRQYELDSAAKKHPTRL